MRPLLSDDPLRRRRSARNATLVSAKTERERETGSSCMGNRIVWKREPPVEQVNLRSAH